MMKKSIKTIFLVICFFSFFVSINASTSLKDLKDELAKDEKNKNVLIKKQNEVQKQINKMEKNLKVLGEEIDEYAENIQESKEKIVKLNEDIVTKNKEIDQLISFLQVSDGDNVYLEYVFNAKDFTDFIYRSAIVEQLTSYNDELVDDMYVMIEENKKLQKELAEEIKKSEVSIAKLQSTLKESNLDMEDLSEDKKDINADIKARKVEINYYVGVYEKNGCSEDTDIYECIGVPYANGFTRPINKGSVTSNFGMRYHPTLHYYRMHNGIDLGVATGNKVYASATGIVNKITVRSSCGGNMVWIQHNIGGKKYRTVYQHLHTVKVKVGDVVTMNTVIGTSGGGESYDNCSTGPHLHFGILSGWTGSSYINPRTFIYFPAKGKSFSTRFY